MRRVTTIIVLTFGAQAHGKELAANDIAGTQETIDKLVDKLAGKLAARSLKVPTLHADLDDTTFWKSGNFRNPSLPAPGKALPLRSKALQTTPQSSYRPSKTDIEYFLQEGGLIGSKHEPFHVVGMKTLTTGYLNFVYKVELENDKDKEQKVVVAKLYSDVAKCRQKPHLRGLVDRMADQQDLGPRVHYSSEDGIVTDFVPGTLLNASEFMRDERLRQVVARRLARLHNMETLQFRESQTEPLIWCTCDAMTSRTKRDLMLPGFDLDELIEHVQAYRSIVESTSSKLVTCHGDFKPANIMQLSRRPMGSLDPGILFIDFELAGPGYRGYDIFKLFRAEEVDEDKLRQFVIDYLKGFAPEKKIKECEIERLYAEALMFEPLTYLEPVIFFNAAASEFPDQAERFTGLAHARWEKYLKTKHYIKERADALHRLRKSCKS